MNRSEPLRSDPEKTREWRRRGARNYEERLRGEGRKFSDLERSTPLSPINPERRKKERLRAYGPEKRRELATDGDCAVEGCPNPPEQAHLKTGGTGRKADADAVARLCGVHHRTHPLSLHNLGSVDRFDEEWGTDLWADAEALEEEWQDFLRNKEAA